MSLPVIVAPLFYFRQGVIDAGLDPDHLRLRDNLGRGPGARRPVPLNI